MAAPSLWNRSTTRNDAVSLNRASPPPRNSSGTYKWIAWDVATVLVGALSATTIEYHSNPIHASENFWRGSVHAQGAGFGYMLVTLLVSFIACLIVISWRLHLYAPERLHGHLHEQRLSLEACLTAGLVLNGAIYLIHAVSVSRILVLSTIGISLVLLSIRRIIHRSIMHRQFLAGVATRNILIVGTGLEAQALKRQIQRYRQLGYTFKGFIEFPGAARDPHAEGSGDVVGSLDELFEQARIHFVDEIFLTSPQERGLVQHLLEEARKHSVDLRVVPDMYDGLAWNRGVEYVGQFPTFPLHRGEMNHFARTMKRLIDIIFAGMGIAILCPLMAVISILIKLDSRGPVFYRSDRVGRKGRIFKCTKFRTMTCDADTRRAEIMHMNERDGVLFKVSNDPRITRLGRMLRKYSLDEFPQLFDVVRGDMSLVGPRPPLASEVREYKPNHLRRLDVTPGITGLWQVQARQDPSFDSYISLDVTYIESWSVWLDMKILIRTFGVVLAGTGT